MIFVTLGTQDKSFIRLLKEIEECKRKGTISEDVVVQAGYTKYSSEVLKIFDYVDSVIFNKYMQDCSLLITHGGVGSIMTGLKSNKPVIACPRLAKFKEHTNDHQKDIVNEFAKLGYIIPFDENTTLEKCLNIAKNFKVTKPKSNTDNIITIISSFIDKGER